MKKIVKLLHQKNYIPTNEYEEILQELKTMSYKDINNSLKDALNMLSIVGINHIRIKDVISRKWWLKQVENAPTL